MIRKFTHAVHVPGALSGDLGIRFTAPSNCTLLHVSTVASNATNGTIALGISTATTGFMTAKTLGVSGTPVVFTLPDFNGALLSQPGKEFPRITAGDIVVVTVARGGTAAEDVTVVLTFAEG